MSDHDPDGNVNVPFPTQSDISAVERYMSETSDIRTAAIGAWRRHRGNDLITDGMLAIFEDAIRTERQRSIDFMADNSNWQGLGSDAVGELEYVRALVRATRHRAIRLIEGKN